MRTEPQILRSAAFQPAVSPISNRQGVLLSDNRLDSSGCRLEALRYSRLETCATGNPRLGHTSTSAGAQLWLIARKEFSDRFRSGWVIACIAVWLGAIGLTSFLGLLQIGQIGVQGYERTVISLLNLVQYLVPLLGLLLGHDLLVSEQEERTLRFVLACGVSRARLVIAKFLGGCLTLTVPLVLGFTLAGAAIWFTAKDRAFMPFLTLAISGLALGVVFLALGLGLSAFSRTRVQALVLALLAWCIAVFVFDLVALGVLLSTKSIAAAQEIEMVCDATHVNAATDIHSCFDNVSDRPAPSSTMHAPSLGWLAANPVDLFRAANLSKQIGLALPWPAILLSASLWLALPLGAGLWRLRRTDL
jgi:ABC-type transport system involved in multi-copper enzyme maturation permease subunit